MHFMPPLPQGHVLGTAWLMPRVLGIFKAGCASIDVAEAVLKIIHPF
jgi:hypothetical protein